MIKAVAGLLVGSGVLLAPTGYGHQEWQPQKRLLQGLCKASRGLKGSLIGINSTHHISQPRHMAVSHLTEKRGTDLTHRLTRLCESDHRSIPH